MPKKYESRKRLGPQERRDLDVEIQFIEGVVKRDPQFVEALKILGDDYTRRGRFVDGLKVDEQLLQLRPEDPMVHYNLACSYSLTEHFELAAAALDKALNLGYRDFGWLSKDPDLKQLRKHPLYKDIQAKVKNLSSEDIA